MTLGRGGDRSSVLALANLRYAIGTFARVTPYVMGGVGVYTRTALGVGTSMGMGINIRQAHQSPLYVCTEPQGLTFFDHSRLLAGVSKSSMVGGPGAPEPRAPVAALRRVAYPRVLGRRPRVQRARW